MSRIRSAFRLLFTTPYRPQPSQRSFLSRGQTQEDASVRVTVAVLDAAESEQVFAVVSEDRAVVRAGRGTGQVEPAHLRSHKNSRQTKRGVRF